MILGALLRRSHAHMYGEERLRPLRSYRYRGVDMSLISRYVLAPYWNWVVTLFPLWMAPNLITLIGLAFMVAALGVALYYTPDLAAVGPRWVYFFYAACMWIYSTLDNVDGKQARRTGSSSPLGELFDHGCDALNCSIGGVVQIAAMGTGSTRYSFLIMGIIFWAFYLPTWEHYHTGILYLGYVNGPTEGLIIAMFLIILSGIYGPQIWRHTFGQQFPTHFPPSSRFHSFSITNAAVYIVFSLFLLIYVPTCILAVRQACHRQRSSFPRALTQLIPMLMVSLASCAWLLSPHSSILTRNFALFVLAIGVGFGKMATKIIYAHLTKRHFPYHSGLMLPLFLGCLLVNLPAILPIPPLFTPWVEEAFVWGWLGVALIGYLNWSYHVINSFCSYLDIYCFSIKHRQSRIK